MPPPPVFETLLSVLRRIQLLWDRGLGTCCQPEDWTLIASLVVLLHVALLAVTAKGRRALYFAAETVWLTAALIFLCCMVLALPVGAPPSLSFAQEVPV